MKNPAQNLQLIHERIKNAAQSVGREARDINVVAVSKRQPLPRIEALLEAGHRLFGENRVQEALQRWPSLKERFEGVELHLVGPLQSNKTEEALALFDVIHSLDRPKLARKIAGLVKEGAPCPKLFVQVNTGEEPQKAGVLPHELEGFMTLCREELSLPIEGLMCLPPQTEEPALHFAFLQKLSARYGLKMLSMGMSGDFETAIEFGATHIRLGTVLFGEREE